MTDSTDNPSTLEEKPVAKKAVRKRPAATKKAEPAAKTEPAAVKKPVLRKRAAKASVAKEIPSEPIQPSVEPTKAASRPVPEAVLRQPDPKPIQSVPVREKAKTEAIAEPNREQEQLLLDVKVEQPSRPAVTAEVVAAPEPAVTPQPAQQPLQNQPLPGQQHHDRRDDRGNRRFKDRGRRHGRDRGHHQYEQQQSSPGGEQYSPGGGSYAAPAAPTEAASPPAPPEFGEGLVEVSGKGFGFLRDPSRSYNQTPQDIFVTPEVCRKYSLRDGQWIRGEVRRGNRGLQLFKLTEIDGEPPENCLELPLFEELTVINPLERYKLETVSDRHTTRIIDMMAPIGRGQRGLIVAPPRTGKTTLLEHIAGGVAKNYPEVKLIMLLVDERPEEVTELRKTCPTAELMASSNDSDVKSHCRIAQLAIERAKRLVEMGKDVFILLDSMTRVGRAFNNATSGTGRTLSGGMDARAMEIPRRLFAAARNTEEAGSLTIIATALIETGSKMDELIFQEFKGTGNMELVLSRAIADMRVYPAVDIFLSGTRREELLIPADELHKINVLRRGLSGHKPMEAIERLISFARKFPTNEQMLRSIPG